MESRRLAIACTLEPRIQLNEQMGNAPEPDTKHWLHRDLYTHIKWGRVSPPETDEEGWWAAEPTPCKWATACS